MRGQATRLSIHRSYRAPSLQVASIRFRAHVVLTCLGACYTDYHGWSLTHPLVGAAAGIELWSGTRGRVTKRGRPRRP
jgi:hypothetical protein